VTVKEPPWIVSTSLLVRLRTVLLPLNVTATRGWVIERGWLARGMTPVSQFVGVFQSPPR
jgi:hypothetical protein